MNDDFSKEMTASHIKNMRLKTGLTQDEFCENFGLNLNTYRHWERGERKPTGSSLVLLNMIENSGSEVLSILSKVKNAEGNMSEGKKILQEIFERREYLRFEDFIKSNVIKNPDIFIALIKANGLPYVSYKECNDILVIFAGNDINNQREVLWVNSSEFSYGGEFKEIIEKSYMIAYSLEEDLRDAVFWTPKMRSERVTEILEKIGVDKDFYNNFLRNW